MEFLIESLKKNKKASYADIKAKADEKKLKLFPIMFGRAQALLGIVKSAKRGQGKMAKARAAKAAGTPVKRGPGRPRKNAGTGLDGIAGILDAVRNSERERSQLRGALERIQSLVADALDS